MTPSMLNPSTFVEGGLKTENANLIWGNPRFNLFTYTKKDGTPSLRPDGKPAVTVSFAIDYTCEDGTIQTQQYSVGDPSRYAIAADGKTLSGPDGGPVTLVKSSHFGLLMQNLVAAGFPEDRFPEDGDVSIFDGMEAHHIGLEEPKRPGLNRPAPAEGERARTISVPDKINKLPWEKKGKKSKKAGAPAAEVDAAMVEYVGRKIEESDDAEVTRAQLAGGVFSDPTAAANGAAIAARLYDPDGVAALEKAGYVLDGDTLSTAE